MSRDVTLNRLSVLIGIVDNSPLDDRLHLNASHSKECLTHHPCIRLSLPVLHAQVIDHLELSLRASLAVRCATVE